MDRETKRHIVVTIGTRPEALKLAPVILELRKSPRDFKATILSTGQHREMLSQALGSFGLSADVDLAVMKPGQTLSGLTADVLSALQPRLEQLGPDLVLVQGDTTTAFTAALASFYNGIPVGHVEAGLRTGDRANPFPEEVNRRLIAGLASIHFAPTQRAAAALRREGVDPSSIHMTGNTVVDALGLLDDRPKMLLATTASAIQRSDGRLVLVTCHRRESFGPDLDAIVSAIGHLARQFPKHLFVFPVHLNPRVRAQVQPFLSGVSNIHLIDPLPYADLLALLEAASVVVTDSGGIQEEAPSFGVPVVVVRRTTERPEGIRKGFARLVSPDTDQIVQVASRWITRDRRAALKQRSNPYGDGRSAQRIVEVLKTWHP